MNVLDNEMNRTGAEKVDSENDENEVAVAHVHRLTTEQKWSILAKALLVVDTDTWNFRRGTLKPLAEEFKITGKTITKILNEWRQQVDNGHLYQTLAPHTTGHGLAHSKLTDDIHFSLFSYIYEHHGRCTWRELEAFLAAEGHPASLSTIFRWLYDAHIQALNIHVKPYLNELQRMRRLRYALMQINKIDANHYFFHDGKGVLHLDEKWFFMTKPVQSVKVLPGQEDMIEWPATQHKEHIPKLMFLCCIGRPDPETQFNGKGFLSPFAEMVPAVRDSKNRNAGTLEIKSINVTAAVYLDKVIGPDGLLDTIKRNHPDWHGKRIIIQQDGATPHTGQHNVEKMNKAGKKDGWKIEFWTQPAQSPDLNFLDLCFFWSLCKRVDKLKYGVKNLTEFAPLVAQAFTEYDSETIDRCFGCWCANVLEVIKHDGCNKYKVAHTGVRKRQAAGDDVASIPIDVALINEKQQLCNAYFEANPENQ